MVITIHGSILCVAQSNTGNTQTVRHKDAYPSFSWDRVPVVAHFGKHDNELSKKEIEFLSNHFPVVVLEKAHAMKTMVSTEAGISHDAARLKKASPSMKVFFYWNAFIDYSPFYEASATFAQHPEWALKDLQGNEVTVQAAKRKRYDHSNPELRNWWTKVAAKECEKPYIDGVFIDALPQLAMNPTANHKIWGEEKQAALEAGLMQSLSMLRQQIGKEKLLIFNGLRGRKDLWDDMGMRYYKHCDMAMIEHFGALQGASKEVMANDMDAIREAGKMGKVVIVKAWPHFNWLDKEMMDKPYDELEKLSREQISFPLAAFLAAAGEYAYFCYTWGYRENMGTFSWYPEFDKPLGKPKGESNRNGWIYTREFEHASVWVDLEKREGRITWR
jgi:hypothetical protein